MKYLILALALAAGALPTDAATPGEFDPAYGTAGPGYSLTPLHDHNESHDLVLYPDGSKVTSGIAQSGTTVEPVLTRYKPDGSIDFAFGAAGHAVVSAMPEVPNGYTQLTQYRDQLYLLVPAGSRLYVYNFNSAGVLNTAFGTGGASVVNVNAGNAIVDIAMQKSRIILAGRMRNPATAEIDFVLIGMKTTGVLDAGFGSGGIALHSLRTGTQSSEYFTGLAITPDYRIVAGGRSAKRVSDPDPYDFVVARFRSNGSVDPGFGTAAAGFTLVDFGYNDFGRRVALYANYQVLIVGSVCKTIDPATGQLYCVIGSARVLNNGALDASWNGSGMQLSDLGGDGLVVTDVTLDRRERAVVSHAWYRVQSVDHRAGLSRYDFLGALDPGFAAGGHGLYDFGLPFNVYHTVKLLDGNYVDTCGGASKETAPGVLIGASVVARHFNF
jgi:uncharacterized delta-60 repeat protein